MAKAILFDLDNTLLDFSGFKRETALAAAKAMKKAGIDETVDMLYKKIYYIYETKGIEYQRTFSDLANDYSPNIHTFERAVQAGIIAYQKKKYGVIKPRPNVIKSLNSLKSEYKLAIVTDAPRDKAWQRLILAGLDGYFYPVVTFSDTGEHKPSPNPFKRACELLKVKSQDAVFVGDNPERDIIGAKKAGMITVLAKYGCIGYKEELDVADYSIDKFENLPKIIDLIEARTWFP